MEGPVERRDFATLRISDEDRHQVTEVLRVAAGEGRIDLEELDARLEAVHAAKTYADLVPITSDLAVHDIVRPPPPRVPVAPGVGSSTYTSSIAVLSETKRRGQWLVPENHPAFAMMGTVQLDLREAVFTATEVTINACAIIGEVKIVVNADTRVVVDGVAIMGDFNEARQKVPAELSAASPTVLVKGLALMGNVTVQRRPMPGETTRRLGWTR